MPIIISGMHNPYFHLALEKQLLDELQDITRILLLYVNRPCVVIGRHQNPWLECNPAYLRSRGIELVRRFSGGGAVYQDTGNLSFAFILRQRRHSPEGQLELVASFLRALGVPGVQVEGNSILACSRKISGSAFYLRGDRYLHHGTLLVTTPPDDIKRTLKPFLRPQEVSSTSAIKSRVMEVTNLASYLKGITVEKVRKEMMDFFVSYIQDEEIIMAEDIDDDLSNYLNQFISFDWIVGRTPPFTYGGKKFIPGKWRDPREVRERGLPY